MSELDARRDEPNYTELEALIVNNGAFQSIEAYLGRFNPIRVMKMEGMEIRHSAILAWLLDPKESHGLGDHFLRAFLSEALKGDSKKNPNALQVSQSDMRDADVRCEWNHIDIFILSPHNGWAFIIENKVRSAQHPGQLAKYRRRITELFRAQSYSSETENALNISGIFLTLSEESAEDPEYTSIRYESICYFLRSYIEQESYLISHEIRTFLKHYLQILEELTGMSKERSEMEDLARQLYRRHKNVLDFIVEHGSGSDFALAARRLFGENPRRGEVSRIDGVDFVYFALSKRLVSFFPLAWREELDIIGDAWAGCDDWWAGYPFIAWIEMQPGNDGTKGKLKLVMELGPISDHLAWKSVIEALTSEAVVKGLSRVQFQTGASDEGRRFSRFLKKTSLAVNDIHDTDEIERKLRQLISDFAREFELVTTVIPRLARVSESA